MDNNLKKLFAEYLQECQYSSGLRAATMRGYRAVFFLFINLMPEVITTNMLSPAMVTEFFKRLQTRERLIGRGTIKIGVKNSTIKTYWSKLNSFFEWLQKKGYLKSNPFMNIKKPPQPRYEDSRALKDEEVDKIIAAAILKATSPLSLRREIAMISLLFYTGLRRGELVSLQIKDIDLEKGRLTIRAETSKSKKTRIVPMHPTLIMHLKDYIDERNKNQYKTEHLLVSTHGDTGLTRDGLRHWERRLNKLSGVKFHLHRFRHSFATNLAKKDVGIVKIQKLLGHASLSMTERYVRSIISEDLQDEINKL
jgi:integrase/recombinase XerD